ncbi:MAG TPA: hypothetical protein PK788_00300 [Gemmatimonadaceae bacterium]|nr:hypothetical protein [Gemmatimonadaceae bacterium]
MRFFLDACISQRIAHSLALAAEGNGQTVKHLTDLFEPNTPDVEWIRALKQEGDWIIISADPRITRNRIEHAAWQESGLTAFFLVDFSRRKFWDQLHELVSRWPDIVIAAREGAPGSGYLIKPRQKSFPTIFEPATDQ